MIGLFFVRALISVSDKSKLEDLLEFLEESQYEIFSTGGTLDAIHKLGFKAKSVRYITGIPEMLGGRVKTLDHKIFAGILAKDSDQEEMKNLNLDLVHLL